LLIFFFVFLVSAISACSRKHIHQQLLLSLCCVVAQVLLSGVAPLLVKRCIARPKTHLWSSWLGPWQGPAEQQRDEAPTPSISQRSSTHRAWLKRSGSSSQGALLHTAMFNYVCTLTLSPMGLGAMLLFEFWQQRGAREGQLYSAMGSKLRTTHFTASH
jgi:hypothetical protein